MPISKRRTRGRRAASASATATAATALTRAAAAPSKLKRKTGRLTKKATASKKPQPPVAKKMPEMDTLRLSALADASAAVVAPTCASDVMSTMLPRVVAEAAALLPCGVASVLREAPKVPRAILLAAEPASRVDPTLVVVCLLHLMAPPPGVGAALERAADAHTPFADVTSPSAVTERAAEWALRLLTELVKVPRNPSVHEHVSVMSRERLGISVLCNMQGTLQTDLLPALCAMPYDRAVANLHAIQHALIPVLCQADARLVLSTVLAASLHVRHPVSGAGAAPVLCEPFERALAQHVKVPYTLSSEAQVALLLCSGAALSAHLARLADSIDTSTSPCAARALTRQVADAAARCARVHWRVMDGVRRAVGRTDEPFSLPCWRGRLWTRAVLTVAAESLGIALVSRVVPSLRRCVRQALVLQVALRDGHNVAAGVLSARALYDGLGLAARLGVSVNMQATLLCTEGVVERAVWACARAVREGGMTSEDEEVGVPVVRVCAGLVVATALVRMCAKRVVEKEAALVRRRELLVNVIHGSVDDVCGRGVYADVRMTGLLAVSMVAAGRQRVGAKWMEERGDEFERAEWAWGLHVAETIEKEVGL